MLPKYLQVYLKDRKCKLIMITYLYMLLLFPFTSLNCLTLFYPEH